MGFPVLDRQISCYDGFARRPCVEAVEARLAPLFDGPNGIGGWSCTVGDYPGTQSFPNYTVASYSVVAANGPDSYTTQTFGPGDPSPFGGVRPAGEYGVDIYNGALSNAWITLTLTCQPPAPTCTPVSTSQGPLTAAVVDPAPNYAGPLPVSGCQIGVYFDTAGSVTSADISGATHYGVFADKGVPVNVTGSQIHQIGDVPFTGNQNGRAVFYANGATGTVSGNTITAYQKNGIVATGSHTAVNVLNNTVTGRGHINTIAQNGIVILSGATALIKGNTVSSNWYTGPTWTACGLLFYQAGGVKQSGNTLFANQTNLCNAGRGGGNFKP
jgi:Periplasmic copper-binding protein (NosD)